MLINPETTKLEYLLYKVTYFGNENPPFSALKYENHRNSDGMFFPRILAGYIFENDSTKSLRYKVTFADAVLLDEEFDVKISEKPAFSPIYKSGIAPH